VGFETLRINAITVVFTSLSRHLKSKSDFPIGRKRRRILSLFHHNASYIYMCLKKKKNTNYYGKVLIAFYKENNRK
jgi:hypothetical protein